MESKNYQVYMFGDEPGHILYRFSGSRTLEEAYKGIEDWKGWRPELKYYRITEFLTTSKLIEDTRVEKSKFTFWTP